jgi:clan AA aspartic protease (TIGR02281 family)
MLSRQHPSATILLLASTLALVSVACSEVNPLDSSNESVKRVSDPANKTTASTNTPLISSNLTVFTAPIKRRAFGTPVIDVTFNGLHTFEMVMDTGASTTVITPKMADQIGVKVEEIVMADTASDKKVQFGAGKVKSIAVEGAVAKNIKVAIANSGLDAGLLGQDFLSRYDILMKRDVIEFHHR